MEPGYEPPKRWPQREIVIDNEDFGSANLEAWTQIIRSYQALHPEHQVILLYEEEPVQSMTYLFKLGHQLNRAGFALTVAAPDANFKHAAKLYRLLVEGAGPGYRHFLGREVNQTLKLF